MSKKIIQRCDADVIEDVGQDESVVSDFMRLITAMVEHQNNIYTNNLVDLTAELLGTIEKKIEAYRSVDQITLTHGEQYESK